MRLKSIAEINQREVDFKYSVISLDNVSLNLKCYGTYLYGSARMNCAHGADETIGRSIATNREAVQPAVARRLTGRSGGLPDAADFQAHAAKLP